MKCKICQQEKVCVKLHIEGEEENTPYDVYLCDTCWDIIFQIAKNAAEAVDRKNNKERG